MKKGIVVLLVLALAGGAGAGVYYHWFRGNTGTESGRVSSDSEDAVYVDSVSMLAGLGSGDGLIQRYAGIVEPQQTWSVKLENERTVKACLVEEGDEVKTGQRLFTYDTTDDQDKLAQAQIDLERTQNDIATSKANKEQLEKEKAKASADDQLSYTTRILTEENSIKQSEYEYKSKQLEIKQLKERIADATVTSEIDGVIKSINNSSDSGSSYSSDSGDNAYITILEMGDYRVKGTVNEQNMSQISEGMDVIVHSRVDDSVTWHGTITEINRDKGESSSSDSFGMMGGSSSDSSSSTNYPFYVELDSSDNLILGQHVYLEPDQGQADQKDGIWLDDYYFVIEDDGSSYVWAASASNTLEKRKVTLGEYDEDLFRYQVLDGLTADDYIAAPDDTMTAGLPVVYNDIPVEGDDSSGYDDGSDKDYLGGIDGEGQDGDLYNGSIDGAYDADIPDLNDYSGNADVYDADADQELYDDSSDLDGLDAADENDSQTIE